MCNGTAATSVSCGPSQEYESSRTARCGCPVWCGRLWCCAVAPGPLAAFHGGDDQLFAPEGACRSSTEDVSRTGQARWQTRLATQDEAFTSEAGPFAVGRVTVF